VLIPELFVELVIVIDDSGREFALLCLKAGDQVTLSIRRVDEVLPASE